MRFSKSINSWENERERERGACVEMEDTYDKKTSSVQGWFSGKVTEK